MNTLVLEADPQVVDIAFTDSKLIIELADGRSLLVPLSWYPRLFHATPAERENWQLLGDGYAVEWPDFDEHIGIEGLLAGRRSGESEQSLQRWLHNRVEIKQDEAIMQLAWEHKDKLEFVGIEALDELSREKLGEPLSSITVRK